MSFQEKHIFKIFYFLHRHSLPFGRVNLTTEEMILFLINHFFNIYLLFCTYNSVPGYLTPKFYGSKDIWPQELRNQVSRYGIN